MVRLMDEDSKQSKTESIHDKIKKRVAEEVQRKIDTPCLECARKDAEIKELMVELGRIHASMIAGRLNQ